MLAMLSWFQGAARNFFVDKRRLRIWRRWGNDYQETREFKLLKQIESQRERITAEAIGDDTDILWLLPYRAQFRRVFSGFTPVCHQGEIDAIRYYMAYCPREMVPICIWLIGKCADRFRLYGISEFRRDPSPQIRKHVAKALRRLEAWALLEEMAALYPEDANIQRFATLPVSHRSFAERLSSYVKTVDDSHAGEVATPSRMPFWSRDRSWEYMPPKSVLFIRRMLRRIRHWVCWGVS